MNCIAKTAVSNKLSSVSKSLRLDDTEKEEGPSAKELRKLQEADSATRAKLQEQHAKRNAERKKKRDEIRAKYGLKEECGKSNESGNARTKTCEFEKDTNSKMKAYCEGEGKKCNVM